MAEESPRSTGEHGEPTGEHGEHRQTSNADLMSSAKLVAAAAQSAYGGKSESIDKEELAGASEDLLNAAEKYGKLEGSAAGQYVDKAEAYLHNYHSSNSLAGEGEGKAPVSERRDEEKEDETKSGGGGVGDYVNMAKGFFK